LKGGKFRVVEIHPTLKPLLAAMASALGSNDGSDWNASSVALLSSSVSGATSQKLQNIFRERPGGGWCPEFRPYDLRHYFISNAIMSGVDIFTISNGRDTLPRI